jgi:hypothetical protein
VYIHYMSRKNKTIRRKKRKRVLKKTTRKLKGGVIEICPICQEDLKRQIFRCPNNHQFHNHCIVNWCKKNRPCTCPLCRDPINMPANILMPAPRDNPHSALTDNGLIRWSRVPNIEGNDLYYDFKPTSEELDSWGIKMPYDWWIKNGLPLGWYEWNDKDPNNVNESKMVYTEEFYNDNDRDYKPEWIT